MYINQVIIYEILVQLMPLGHTDKTFHMTTSFKNCMLYIFRATDEMLTHGKKVLHFWIMDMA